MYSTVVAPPPATRMPAGGNSVVGGSETETAKGSQAATNRPGGAGTSPIRSSAIQVGAAKPGGTGATVPSEVFEGGAERVVARIAPLLTVSILLMATL